MSERSREEGQSNEIIRTFICIDLPTQIKERIGELEDRMRCIEAQVSWVKSSNVHVTLKFLGGVRQTRIESMCNAVSRAARVCSQFELEVGGTGSFPSERNPRVLWVGLADLPDELKSLHRAVEDELEREGFPRESKRFSPHLTIGRVRSPKNAALLVEELTAAGFPSARFTVSEIIVMRSDLKPTGSVYTPQSVIPLTPKCE